MKKTHHVAYMRLTSEGTGDWLVHPKLRPRLVADALRGKTTLTDVVNTILSERYGVPYEPTGRSTKPSRNDEVINVRVPLALWRKVRAAADRAGRRDMDELRVALCDHYRLTVPKSLTLA